MDRIAASRRQRIPGPRSSTRLVVTGIVVALGAASFVVASAADIPPAPTLCSSSNATIRGTSGNDVIVGTSGNDIIWGGAGDDVISGLGGNDRLCGSDGNDRLYGGSGNDYLDGGAGTDVLQGNSGRSDTCLNGEQRTGCEFVGITTPPTTAPPTTPPPTTAPPTTAPPSGRFATLPVGATLPSEQQCAAAVRRMSENRPENATTNAVRGNSPHNDIPRVTGNFTGTTDEILQWAACKWGIDEDLVRAQIAVESWWSMPTIGDNGESFGLGQVRVPYHTNAFENDNAKRSSAYNVDYTYAIWRACFEGQYTWLNTVERGAEYRSGDAMGCAGVWFSGRWRTEPAIQYIARVDDYLRTKVWTTAGFGPSTPGGPPTTPPPTTAPPTTAPPTTAPPTTAPPTTAPPTTAPPTTAPPTTAPPTTAPPTTAPPTTAPPTTAPPTTAPPTTAPPAGAAFVETFTGNTGISNFKVGVWHRNMGEQELGGPFTRLGNNNAGHGGNWTGDHDLNCGSPDTQRALRSVKTQDTNGSNGWNPIVDFNLDEVVYNCVDHMMTSMGDVDGYSVLWFAPKRIFNSNQTKVSWDVSVTNLMPRQWWEVAIIPAGSAKVTTIDWLAGTAGVSSYPAGAVVFGNGPFGAQLHLHSGGQDNQITGNICSMDPEGCASKPIRRTFSVQDNRNGTVTARFGAQSWTMSGSFPAGNFEVIFKDHNYTPDKDGMPVGHTWHWDNIIVS